MSLFVKLFIVTPSKATLSYKDKQGATNGERDGSTKKGVFQRGRLSETGMILSLRFLYKLYILHIYPLFSIHVSVQRERRSGAWHVNPGKMRHHQAEPKRRPEVAGHVA